MKSKFTEANRGEIIRYLKAGNTRNASCRMVGVNPSQLSRWLKEGEDAREGTTHRAFYDEVQAAEAEAEIRPQMLVQQAMRDDPKYATWWLERRRRQDWGREHAPEREVGPVVIQLSLSDGRQRALPTSTVEVLSEQNAGADSA